MRASFPFLLIGLFCIGCGSSDRPPVYPVTGKIIYDGKPVEGATVNFYTDKSPRVASGKTNASGEFELTTFDTGDGAVEGEHIVTVSKQVSKQETSSVTAEAGGDAYSKAMSGAIKSNYKNLADSQLPEKFASKETSGISRTIVAGESNTFTIELE